MTEQLHIHDDQRGGREIRDVSGDQLVLFDDDGGVTFPGRFIGPTAETLVGDTDRVLVVGENEVRLITALTAKRTITLPAASTTPRGYQVTVSDRNRVLTGLDDAIFWSIVPAGGDVINSFHGGTAELQMHQPDTYTVESNGSNAWNLIRPGIRRPFFWWQHDKDVALPSGVWVPQPWNQIRTNAFGESTYAAVTTTVASGSNGQILPQSTINVDSTTGFADDGYLVITGPPAAGKDTIVAYTGKTGTSFTGCNTAYRGLTAGISQGTLATGQVVAQAHVEFTPTAEGGYLWNTMIEFCINNLATTAYWGIRLRSIDNFFNLVIARNDCPGINIGLQHLLLPVQPGFTFNGLPSRLEVFHNGAASGRYSKVDGIQSPSLMAAFMSTK